MQHHRIAVAGTVAASLRRGLGDGATAAGDATLGPGQICRAVIGQIPCNDLRAASGIIGYVSWPSRGQVRYPVEGPGHRATSECISAARRELVAGNRPARVGEGWGAGGCD